MKKNFILLSVAFFLAFSNHEVLSQKIQKKKITPEVLKEWDTTVVAENLLSKISAVEKS